VLAVIVPIWGAAALVSTWIAGRLGNLASTLVVGLLLVAAVAFNLSMLPYPIWFKVACLVVIPAAAVAGGYRRRGRLQRAG
jgi:predicted MFS family arabinose efflux permease